MKQLLKRYRMYLGRTASSGESDHGWQMLPWFVPISIAAAICFAFDLRQPENLYFLLPAGAIGIIGIAYVTWVFLIEGPIATYRAGRKAKSDQSDVR